MIKSRLIVFCPHCEVHWDLETESPKCDEDGHDHQRLAVHRHLDAVLPPDGITVTAASFDPQLHIYGNGDLTMACISTRSGNRRGTTTTSYGPDFGVPHDARPVLKALKFLWGRAHSGRARRDRVRRWSWAYRDCLGLSGGVRRNAATTSPWPGSGPTTAQRPSRPRASRFRLLALSPMTERRPALRVGGGRSSTNARAGRTRSPNSEPDRQDWLRSARSCRNRGIRPAPKS